MEIREKEMRLCTNLWTGKTKRVGCLSDETRDEEREVCAMRASPSFARSSRAPALSLFRLVISFILTTGVHMAKNETKKDVENMKNAPKQMELPVELQGELVQLPMGFPPYWLLEEGATICCIPRTIDLSDVDFPRFICECLSEKMTCYQGAKDRTGERNEIEITRGERFTVGVAATLKMEFAIKDAIPLLVTVLTKDESGKLPNGKPRSMWNFDVQTLKKYKAAFDAEKIRSSRFGSRYIRDNNENVPNLDYFEAFTDEGLKLSAPNRDGVAQIAAAPARVANAEA